MSIPPPYKLCPKCQTSAAIDAQQCAQCGHVYRTQFTPPPHPDQTQAFNMPPGVAGHVPTHPNPPPSQRYQPPPPPQGYYPAPPPQQPYYGPSPQWGAAPPGWIQVAPGTHSVAAAVLLSFLCLVCAGQFYNRQYGKGLALLVGSIVCAVCTVGFSCLLSWPIALIDAGMVAQKLNRGQAVREWEWF